ncbi:MAG: thioredoxin [Gemmataceae bacterium]
MASKNVLELTTENWQTEVLQSSIPVLVDFWAVWCGPCRMIAPYIDQLADEFAGKAKVGKVNVDDHQELAAQYGITSIPRVLIFKDGQIVERIDGARDKTVYQKALQRALGQVA